MYRFAVGLAVWLYLSAAAPAQKAPKPESAPDYSQEGYVIEELHNSYRFEADGTGKRELRARIKVQSEAGVQQWGQLVYGYNSANERVEIPYVRVRKADGSTVTAAPDAVQDLSAPVEREAPVYTDYRQKHVTVPGLRPGEVLEYDIISVIHTPLAPGQFWMEHRFVDSGIVLDEQLEVDIPRERTVKLKTQPGFDPTLTEEQGRRIYRWASSRRQRDDDDSDKKKKKKKEPEPPQVQMTTFADWEEMGRWYGGLEKDRRQPNDEIRKKAAELIQGKTSDLDKVQALYDYVATNFRYISLSFGVGRYQPHAAAEVLHNQYGDCKDKHTLLASLLEASGYHASSVLINSGRKIDPDVPSPLQIDHVITLLPLGKEEVWMDTTTEVAPFRMLAATLRKKQALVIPTDGAPHLEETPADPPVPNLQVQEIDGKVSDLGKLNARVKLLVRGDAELLMRVLFRRVPNAEWQHFVGRMSSLSGLDGDVSDVRVSDPAATREPFQVNYQIAAANFFDWSKKKADLDLPLAGITLTDADEENTDANDKIELGSPIEYDYRIRLEFPAKYTARAPLPFSMKRDYAEYDASYKVEGNVFTAERKLITRVRDLPGTRVSDYLAFHRAVLADLGQHLSVDASAANAPAAAELQGNDLSDAANAALERGNYQLAADLYRRLLDTDPKRKNAWINLGRAYMGLRQTDQAIGAFQKQADANPYDETAFNNLGWAYTMARRYNDAEAALRKSLEINPLSKYAHGALASMYVEQHKYDLAVPEFEKAASLNPENPLLQVNLGDAYLNLGEDEKALAAFDRALDISATPLVWNNIAYQLSLRKVHLDRAQQYAESAVAATVAASRNLSLDELNERDLLTMQSLSAYWDTLGWVHFVRGDLDRAQKYISAAWWLSQRPEIGDHLAQVYEKQGKKDDAIRTYAMALTGVRPDPETRGRLSALAGGDDKADALVTRYAPDFRHINVFKLGVPNQARLKGDFFVLLGAGGTVEGVKSLSGDDQLKAFADTLRTTNYNLALPDDNPTRILRRGVLSCPAAEDSGAPALSRDKKKTAHPLPAQPKAAECVFSLLTAEDVLTVK